MKKTTKSTKINFNKFFPEMQGFIALSGKQESAEDWQLSLTVQTSPNKYFELWTCDWDTQPKELDYLYQLQSATAQAITFIEKCKADQKAAKKPTIDKDKSIKSMKK